MKAEGDLLTDPVVFNPETLQKMKSEPQNFDISPDAFKNFPQNLNKSPESLGAYATSFVPQTEQSTQTSLITMVPVATLTDVNEHSEEQEAGYLSDLSFDEDKHPKVFTKLGENETEEDELHSQFTRQSHRKKEHLLLACLKGKLFKIQELECKVAYIKQKYLEQAQLLQQAKTQASRGSEAKDQNLVQRIAELEQMLSLAEQENQTHMDDKVDLQKQLADVESICSKKLIESQADYHKVKQSLKETITKQVDDRKIILEVLQNQKTTIATLERDLKKEREEKLQVQFSFELNGDKSKKELADKCAKLMADLKQMNSLLMQQACQKSEVRRENLQL